MADFAAAFQYGLTAAETAEAAKREIEAVLNDCNGQLSDATGGKILLERREYYAKDESPFAHLIPAVMMGKKRATYTAITARNPLIPEATGKKLAQWSQPSSGYPLKITYGKIEQSCADKESLERTLLSLLQDVDVAQKLIALMNLEAPVAVEASGQAQDEKN